MVLRTLIVAGCLVAAAPAWADDDGEDFLRLMRQPVAREIAQKHIDNAANKWDGSVFCTPVENRDDERFNAVRRYLEEHPQELWRPQRYLIIQGLRASFPCKS